MNNIEFDRGQATIKVSVDGVKVGMITIDTCEWFPMEYWDCLTKNEKLDVLAKAGALVRQRMRELHPEHS